MADADFRRADACSFLDATSRENEEPLLDGEFFQWNSVLKGTLEDSMQHLAVFCN